MPRTDQRYTEFVRVRVSPALRSSINHAVELSEMIESEWLRRELERAAKREIRRNQ